MKVFEAKSLLSAMEARSNDYKKTREQFVNLQKAFMGMADLGEDFQGKGADNIKSFYREHARNIDEWLAMLDMQIAFLDSIPGTLEEVGISGNTFIDTSFLENELETAYRKSNEIVAGQKQAIKAILEDIEDIVPLEVFSTFDFKQHISNSKVVKDNTVDKVHETDWKLKNEYEKSELNQDYIEKRTRTLIDATGKGKDAQPINFNSKAYYDSKVFKYRNEIHKKTEEYLTIKKEEAEKRAAEKERQRIEALKKKLDNTIDNGDYIKIADEIGYDNLTTEQKVIYNLAKFDKTGDDILNGIGIGLKDVAVDTATGIWDTVTNPMETLEGIANTIIHPVDTFNIIKQGIEESFERDVINGDAESRARWFTYATGMVGTSIVGTKGADKVGKVAKAGKAGQAGAKAADVSKKAIESTKKAIQNTASKLKEMQIPNPFAPQVQFAGAAGKVPYNILDGEKIKEKFIQYIKSANPRSVLPRTNGRWEGTPGNGKWYSDNPEVNAVTKGEPVVFKDGRPDFTPWTVANIKFKHGELDGTKKDFRLVYKKIKEIKGFKSQAQAKRWLSKQGLTPHHLDKKTIQLVPTVINNKIPHIGGASDLRGGY
ncbi:T7SS effector LXG polymorphic toxin [Bacillus haynesii]|uniref:T7SS effector LXG polymorphic toxin n=1 Tax=Bacillus haynesii TaxID=1925021 RepID=UPI00227DD83A|nr:T7SS effector LXG polymorphic toxin [Bacillus haynesii]MCY8015474.1 T7SS effector LXG polymorphic toxin [Bacillus haynesii]